MWWHVLAFGAVLVWLVNRSKSPMVKDEWSYGPPSEGWLRLSQYLTGFGHITERVPMVLWVTEKAFVFVNARDGWDLDSENPGVVCVVPRTSVEQVALYREGAASDLMRALGLGEGMQHLLACPENGVVLLQLDLTDVEGVCHQPVFLLDTGEMMPGEDEQMVAFMCGKSLEPRPDGYVIETALQGRN